MEQNKKVKETGDIFTSLNTEIIKVNESIKEIDTEISGLDDHKVLIENSADAMTSFAEEMQNRQILHQIMCPACMTWLPAAQA